MKAKLHWDAGFDHWICLECGHCLDESGNYNQNLIHPTHKDMGVFTTKEVPIACQFVGQVFKNPFVYELQPI